MAGSHGRCIFNLLRNCQTFPGWLYQFAFPPVFWSSSFFFTIFLKLSMVNLFHFSILIGTYCISGFNFNFSDYVEHVFMCSLAVCISFLVKWFFKYFPIQKLFSYWAFENSLYIMDVSPLSAMICQYLAVTVWLFIVLTVSF